VLLVDVSASPVLEGRSVIIANKDDQEGEGIMIEGL
jgi:hypothetical protein